MEQLRVIDNRNQPMKNGVAAFYMARPDGTAFHSQPADWYPMPSNQYNDRYDQQNQVTKIHVGPNMGNGVGYGTARYQVMTSRIPTGDFRYSIEPHKNTKEECNNEGGAKTKPFDYNFPHYFSTKPFREQISWLRPYLYPRPPDPCDVVNIIDEDREECNLVMQDDNKDELDDACIRKSKRKKKTAEYDKDEYKSKRECRKSSWRKSFCGCCKIVLVSMLVSLILLVVSTAINWTILMKTSEQFTSPFDVVVRYNNESYDARLADTNFLSYRLHEIKFCFLMKALFGEEMKNCSIFYFSSGSLVVHARITVTQRYLAIELIKIGMTSSSDVIERMLMNQIGKALGSRTDVTLEELHLVDTTQPTLAVVRLNADIIGERSGPLNGCTDKSSEDCRLIFCRELKQAFSKWFDELFGSCAVNGVNRTDSGINVVDLTMELMYDKLSEEALSNGKAATDDALLNILNGAILKAAQGLLFSTNTRAIASTKSRYTGTKTTPLTTTSTILSSSSPDSSLATERKTTTTTPSPNITTTEITTVASTTVSTTAITRTLATQAITSPTAVELVTSVATLTTTTSSVTTPQTTNATDGTHSTQATEAAPTLLPQSLKESENGADDLIVLGDDDDLIVLDLDSGSSETEDGSKNSKGKNDKEDFEVDFGCNDEPCEENKNKKQPTEFVSKDVEEPGVDNSKLKRENSKVNEENSDTMAFSNNDDEKEIVRHDKQPQANKNTDKVNEDRSSDRDSFGDFVVFEKDPIFSEQKDSGGIKHKDEGILNYFADDKKDTNTREDPINSFQKNIHDDDDDDDDDGYLHGLHDDGKDSESAIRSSPRLELQDQLNHNYHNQTHDQINQDNHDQTHDRSHHNNRNKSHDQLNLNNHHESRDQLSQNNDDQLNHNKHELIDQLNYNNHDAKDEQDDPEYEYGDSSDHEYSHFESHDDSYKDINDHDESYGEEWKDHDESKADHWQDNGDGDESQVNHWKDTSDVSDYEESRGDSLEDISDHDELQINHRKDISDVSDHNKSRGDSLEDISDVNRGVGSQTMNSDIREDKPAAEEQTKTSWLSNWFG